MVPIKVKLFTSLILDSCNRGGENLFVYIKECLIVSYHRNIDISASQTRNDKCHKKCDKCKDE